MHFSGGALLPAGVVRPAMRAPQRTIATISGWLFLPPQTPSAKFAASPLNCREVAPNERRYSRSVSGGTPDRTQANQSPHTAGLMRGPATVRDPAHEF